jgi:hypothetical protein
MVLLGQRGPCIVLTILSNKEAEMQPIRCQGGYAVPIKAGKMEIVGIQAPCEDIASMSRLRVVDNGSGEVLAETSYGNKIVAEGKRMTNVDGNITIPFPEPLKVTDGVNVTYAQNLVPGSILVYVR